MVEHPYEVVVRGSDNSNKRWSGGNLDQNNIYYNFFSRKVTFMFSLQENTVFTFTSLVLKERNVINSLRDQDSYIRVFYYFALFYYGILFVVCFYKTSGAKIF